MKRKWTFITAFSALALLAPVRAADDQAPADNKAAKASDAAPVTPPQGDNDKGIRLNLRDVPLDQVLNYMSDAAGFIINIAPGTEVRGKVNLWSNQPLTKDEAVDALNVVLQQNNLTAIRTGRTLTIIDRDKAKQRGDLPVKKEPNPEKIPRSDTMVTQIIPVRYANAAALVQNLQPLLPEYAQNGLSANESGNSLILTATQTDIHRMAEIVSALDTAIASVSEIKVFALKYADAKSLVDSVKELFAPPTQQQQGGQGGRGGQFLQQMFGGGGGPFGGGGNFGGGPGGGGRGGNGGAQGSRGNTSASAPRVVAVADERSNSLIVAAASEVMPEVERLVKEIDVEVDDVTELRVFPLRNANPTEMADLISQLFPDPTTTSGNQQGRFGGFNGGGFNGGGFNRFAGLRGQQTGTTSDRAKKQGRVLAVADMRTSSLIVTAARELMPQLEAMIKQLDTSGAKRKKVYTYTVENADVTQVEQLLRDMFDTSNTSRNNQQQSALANRQTQAAQQQGLNQNTTGFGAGGGGGGGLGNQFGR